MEDESTLLAQKLVATVARAFYPDNYVVLFDALVREKYIRQEELGPRLKLPNEEVRKMVVQLENERMITYEERLMESDLRRAQCYYIDYQHFVHLVRYRIHLMQKDISKSEDVELNRHFLLCPTCKTKFSELEYYKVRDKNNVFICPQCCPLQNFRTVASEKYYQLVEYDRTEKVNEVQLLAAKFKRQFRRSDGHDGIYDILAQLKDVPVSRNLPSENVARGNVTSRVVDSDIQNEIDYNHMALKTKKLTKRQIEHRKAISSTAGEFKVEFMDDKASNMTEWNGKRAPEEALHALGDEPAVKRPRELPEFLQGSRIREETTSRDIDGFGNKLTSVAQSDSKTEGDVGKEDKAESTDATAMENDDDMWED